MIRVWMALALVAAGIGCAAADDGTRIVGSWMVTVKEDRFGEGGSFSAFTPDDARDALGVRCIENELTLALLNMSEDAKPLNVGDSYVVKLRVDKEPVVTTAGKAINPRLIQIDTKPEVVRAIRKGRETAVRTETESGVASTMVFRTRDNAKALARVTSECRVD